MTSTCAIKDYRVSIHEVIDFVFPSKLQHPLSTGRLYVYAFYGPLDKNSTIRCGILGRKPLLEYELNEMCNQYEREDLLLIYLHNPRDLGRLSSKEQDSIINQADKQFKIAKGKAYLPQITLPELQSMIDTLSTDKLELVSFHDIQSMIITYREERIKKFKLVYPNLSNTTIAETNTSTKAVTRVSHLHKTVSDACAPPEMFKHMEGLRNSDIADKTNASLNKHSFKIAFINQLNNPEIRSNVGLIREMKPKFKDPYIRQNGSRVKADWNGASNMTATSVGSMVNASLSSTTWKPKYTQY